VDELSKVGHLLGVNTTHKEIDITQIFMKEIFRLHEVPKKIISGRDAKFTSNF